MKPLLSGCFSAWLAAAMVATALGADESAPRPVAATKMTPTNKVAKAIDPNDPVEKEYQKLLSLDDAAQEEVEQWMKNEQSFADKGASIEKTTLSLRIRQRLEPVGKAYEAFLQRHPDHARARLAYGSYLGELGEEDASLEQWDKARLLDPSNPAPWNNMANVYGHRGPVQKAFEYYAKAIELNPREAVYYENLATTVYLFRRDAEAFYKISEPEVFAKSLALYRQAMALDPENFALATDYAQSFYGTRPPQFEEGLKAWQHAMKLASSDLERQGVLVHYARIKINLARLEEAQRDLNSLTNSHFTSIKGTLQKKLDKTTATTNGPAAQPAPAAKAALPGNP